MESETTKKISNETVCGYFYMVFVAVSILASITVVMDLWVMSKNPRLGITMLTRSVLILAISVANALFMYILCARTLLK
jgi:hypothetical protein